jgi:hypothetical protein
MLLAILHAVGYFILGRPHSQEILCQKYKKVGGQKYVNVIVSEAG